jgi:dihydroorotase-like cyclic amidohydrolase
MHRRPTRRHVVQSDGRAPQLEAGAARFGLPSKGNIAPGYDADIAIVDPHESFVVRAAESVSEQGYSPFEASSSAAG